MKKLVLPLLLLTAIAAAVLALHSMDVAQDRRLCALMEQRTTFDGETVDVLWHWKTRGRPSARFNRLYADKIKDLPGWRP